ncbi:MAG: DDE-type integrase/transposase/recombinase [Gammaproteobacteria bacterium]|nr:DDE-type integrase/transposase/recombinase [Gammaproteobacteria bacterium]
MTVHNAESTQQLWARLRFAVVSSLLCSPPAEGELQLAVKNLAARQWLHPITQEPIRFGRSTIERWYYRAREAADPFTALRSKQREDAGRQRALSIALKQALLNQYINHKTWSYQLHADNIRALVIQSPELGPQPSYSSILRYMKAEGLKKQKRPKRNTAGAEAAEKRLESLEVRSYEVDYIHGLWHLDFHQGSLKILTPDGEWVTAILLALMDDRSRVVCHAQWYLDETAETLVHGFSQAIQKRGLPRAVMTDNGAAMVAAEFTQGLERLGITHQTTLPYSPYQNGKQEFFWTNIEGRLLPMLEGETELTLLLLNRATQAWVEQEYHHREHSELGCSPIQRYLAGPDVGRESPSSEQLRQAFRIQDKRKQRYSDGTISLLGQRFEIPSRYRHLERPALQYARWDLSHVTLVDERTNTILCRLYPLDKSANASGKRRSLDTKNTHSEPSNPAGIAPLLKQLMAEYAATGLPPAYIPKDTSQRTTPEDES